MWKNDIKARAEFLIDDLAQYGARSLAIENRYKEKIPEGDIYGRAQQRQLALISLCFDVCIQTIVRDMNYPEKSLLNRGIIIRENQGMREIRSTDFYDMKSPENMTDDEKASARKRMVDFLEKKCLVIFDGGVKSENRAREKTLEDPEAGLYGVNDINRLTVASVDLPLLEKFAANLEKAPVERNSFAIEVCAKHVWEWKSHGLLSRTNIVVLDSVPTEVHLNEPRQLLLGNALTHIVYEAFRTPGQATTEGELRFNELFKDIPQKTEISVRDEKTKAKFSEDEYNILLALQAKLSQIILENMDSDLRMKNERLKEFNREAHKRFFEISSDDWMKAYNDAKEVSNYKKNHNVKRVYNNPEKEYPSLAGRPMNPFGKHDRSERMDI